MPILNPKSATRRWLAVCRLVIFGLGGVSTSACYDNWERLGGSIYETHGLNHNMVRSYWLAQELVISFEKPYGLRLNGAFASPAIHQVTRLWINAARQELTTDEEIVFAGPEIAAPFATVEHYTVYETIDGELKQTAPFPEIHLGTIKFTELGESPDEKLVGEFDVVFDDGNTLWGDFDSVLREP